MKRSVVVGGTVLAVIAAAGVYVANVFPAQIAPVERIDVAGFSEERIAQGENLAKIGDCAACHRPPGGQGMSGGLGLPTPFGTIHATNITPDPETGIGTWSYAAFERAMRDGIDRTGRHLYPAFPFDHFAAVSDADLEALYQYLMTREPVRSEPVANDLRFPYSFRPLLAGWKLLYHRKAPFVPDPDLNDEENRGAYLALTLGHCTACHSPRNAFGAVRQGAFFEGGEAEGWLVPPLASASISPLGWDFDDYADYLFDGWSGNHGIAGGPMTPVVDHLYDADEDDVLAIAAWLARITPPVDEDSRDIRREEIAARDLAEDFDPEAVTRDAPDAVRRGAGTFRASCSKCHKERIADSQPVSLGLTYAVNAPLPTNLFNAVLHGIEPGFGASSRRMQAVDLSPDDLAAVAAFVRWRFSDRPAWENLEDLAAAAVAASGGGH